MIAYADSSIVIRSIAPDELGSAHAAAVISSDEYSLISSSMTQLECTSAAVRSTRNRRLDPGGMLTALDALIDPASGLVLLVDMGQAETEALAIEVARDTGLRAMDAWHIACAELCFRELAEPGETLAFATRDNEQAEVARGRGWQVL